MEETNRSRAMVSIGDAKMEFEGTEAFVEKQVEKFASLIQTALSKPRPSSPPRGQTDQVRPPSVKPESGDLAGYENVFAVADEKVSIIKSLPGDNKQEKSINAGLLLAFAYDALGTDTVSFESIREVCQTHACLDSSNFASSLKSAKEWFVLTGSSRKRALKLTVPGKRKAQELATSMNNEP